MRPRSAVRIGALLIAAALSGYLLGGCAGDGLEGLSGATELPTLSLPEVTVPEVTVPDVTLPDVTIPTLPEPPDTEGTTTSEPTTTTKPPITTEPATTVVKTETETETETATVTATVPTETAVAAPTLAETTPAEPVSDDDVPWGWVALALGLLIAAVTLGIVLWRRRGDDGGIE
ncbi:MAG TPA: hypothetical protein VK273_05230 [Gaiellaceae bacterium]|nr:hypothetical protein [Gaiellaceae bacterium]